MIEFLSLDLEESYNSCDWRLKIFTETAVSDHHGTTEFFSDNDFKHLEWGGSILGPSVMVPIARAKYKDSIKRRNSTNISNDSIKTKSNVTEKLVNLIKLSDFINSLDFTKST